MMEQIYRKWKESLKDPDDSIFYYHPSLDRIVLGLTMYEIASRPYLRKLGKAKSLGLYDIYINEMVTAWIYDSDEYRESFAFTFETLMTLSEVFFATSNSFSQKHPGLKRVIRNLQYSFVFWSAIAGDMSESRAEELLDDIATDGKRIDSEKISQLVDLLQADVIREGLDFDSVEGLSLIESFDFGDGRNEDDDTISGVFEYGQFPSTTETVVCDEEFGG